MGFLVYIIEHSYEKSNKCIKTNIQLLCISKFWKRLCSYPIRNIWLVINFGYSLYMQV